MTFLRSHIDDQYKFKYILLDFVNVDNNAALPTQEIAERVLDKYEIKNKIFHLLTDSSSNKCFCFRNNKIRHMWSLSFRKCKTTISSLIGNNLTTEKLCRLCKYKKTHTNFNLNLKKEKEKYNQEITRSTTIRMPIFVKTRWDTL